jgi:hypothetical protein
MLYVEAVRFQQSCHLQGKCEYRSHSRSTGGVWNILLCSGKGPYRVVMSMFIILLIGLNILLLIFISAIE